MSELRRTVLYHEHLELGAKMVPFAGWDMPVQYSSVKEECLAVRQNLGIFDVSHMGEFWLEGKEAVDFLDFILPNDIRGAQDGKAIYSPLCREDATIVDDLIVYKFHNEKFLICVNASNIEKDFSFMKSFSEKFNCTLSNRSNDFSLLALQGPKSEETLHQLFPCKDMEYYSFKSTNTPDVYLARTGYTGEDGFEIFGPHDFIQGLWKELLSRGAKPCGLAARDVLRTEVGYPLYGHELDDTVTPLDAGLKWTIKFQKQSFLAKKALESAEQAFQTVKFFAEGIIPRPSYKIYTEDGHEVGFVASGTLSVALNKGIAIARLNAKLFNKNSPYFIDVRGKKYPLTYTAKSFVQGGHK